MGDCLQAGISPWYVTKPTRSTQPCTPLGSLNPVPALIGWGKGGNVTLAGWQVTLCDPIWYVSSSSGAVLVAQTAIRFFTFVLAALLGSLGLVQLSCVTDVSVSRVVGRAVCLGCIKENVYVFMFYGS